MAKEAAGVGSPPARGRREQRAAWYVAFTLLLVGVPAAWNVSSWPTRLRYPGELDGDGIEGMSLAEMQHLRQGVPVYAPASPERFDGMIYGPLYYWAGANLVDAESPAYRPLRIVSLIAMLGCAAGASLLAYWLSRSRLAVALATLVFFSSSLVSVKGLSARSDMMGLVLTFAGFLIVYRFRTTRRLLWSVPLILAGLFFKQQFLAAPLAVFLFLMVEKQYRRAAEFSGLLIGGGFALLGYFQYGAYPGQALLLHLLKYNAIRFSWERLGYSLLLDALIFGVPTLLAFEFLRRHRDRLLMSYLACALVLAVGSSGRQGSGIWYFLEPLLLVSPLLAGLIAECRAEAERYLEVLCLLAFTVFFGTRVASAAPNPGDFARDRAVQGYLRQHFPPGTIGAGSFAGEIVRARLEIPISNLFQYTWLVCQGTIPAADLLGTVEQRRIGVFLFSRDLNDENDTHQENGLCMTEKLHQAILQNYRLDTTLAMPLPEQTSGPTRFYVWVPRP